MIKKIKFIFEYVLVQILDLAFHLLPRKTAIAVGERMGLLASRVMASRHRLILDNLKKSFPEKSESELITIRQEVWKNIGRTAIEFIRLDELSSGKLDGKLEFEGNEWVESARSQKKGIIFATFHFSNWEMIGAATARRFNGVTAIARPMRNPFVDRWIMGKRNRTGERVILHRQAVRESLRELKRGGILGILMDQNLYQGGEFVEFFGRPAATTTLPALLHVRTGAPVLIGYSIRVGDHYRMIYSPPVKFPDIEDAQERIRVYTQILTRKIEEIIREKPEAWFWIHNRWKRKPEPQDVVTV